MLTLTLEVRYALVFVTFDVVLHHLTSNSESPRPVRFHEKHRVHDVDRYHIHSGNLLTLDKHRSADTQFPRSKFEDKAPSRSFFGKTLVVLLESPHVDEYDNCLCRPIAPAQGDAGDNFYRYFDVMMYRCTTLSNEIKSYLSTNSTSEVRVILCNPIQFQTSLVSELTQNGKEWRKTRNEIYKTLWRDECIRYEFLGRLRSYDPNYIINACTGTGPMRKVKDSISDFLTTYFTRCKKYEVTHPTSWRVPEPRPLT